MCCLIPVTIHTAETEMITPSNTLSIAPNSYSLSRTLKKRGCVIRKIDRPIANGASIRAEIDTPRSIRLISNIRSMKLSIMSSTSILENLRSLSSIKMQIYLIFKIRKFSKCTVFHILWIHHYSSFHLWMYSRIV